MINNDVERELVLGCIRMYTSAKDFKEISTYCVSLTGIPLANLFQVRVM